MADDSIYGAEGIVLHGEKVVLGMQKIKRWYKLENGETASIVKTLGLEDKLYRKPNKLSGGQQQRAAIARALATKPAIILADEPTGNLDSHTSQEVIGLLQATSKSFHQTVVMITHDNEIAQLADRTIRIEDGRIAESRW